VASRKKVVAVLIKYRWREWESKKKKKEEVRVKPHQNAIGTSHNRCGPRHYEGSGERKEMERTIPSSERKTLDVQ